MDNSAQSGSQNDDVRSSAPAVSQQSAGFQPVAPVGSVQKESAPLHQSEHHAIEPAPHEKAPVISQEIAKHVEVSADPEKLHLTSQQKSLGIKEAKEFVPAPTQLTNNVTYPMTNEEVVLAHKLPVSDPVRWLGTLILRELKRAHQKLVKGN